MNRRATKAHEDAIKGILHSTVEDLPEEDMVGKLKQSYKDEIQNFNDDLQGVLRTGFDMSRDEVYEYLSSSEREAHSFAVKELKNVFAQNAPQSLLRRFNKYFKKDEAGKLRNWKDIEEKKITEIFEQSRQKVEELT